MSTPATHTCRSELINPTQFLQAKASSFIRSLEIEERIMYVYGPELYAEVHTNERYFYIIIMTKNDMVEGRDTHQLPTLKPEVVHHRLGVVVTCMHISPKSSKARRCSNIITWFKQVLWINNLLKCQPCKHLFSDRCTIVQCDFTDRMK